MKLLDKVKSLLSNEDLNYGSRVFGEAVLILYIFSAIIVCISLCMFVMYFVMWSLPHAYVVRAFVVGILLGILGIVLCANLPLKKSKR